MLAELRIKDLLLIEEAELSLDSGFIVFTGETGAGKSLLVKAIKLILGEKGGGGLLREGAKEGVVEALLSGGKFLAERLSALGFPPEEELHIKRVFTRTRQRAYVNGSPVTLSELKKLTKGLVSLTGQHEFYSFLNPENYLEILDLFAGLRDLRLSYEEAYQAYRQRLRKLEELESSLKEAEAKKIFSFIN
jgi:DNA repair protein RecN (Recombination protein N)